MNIQYDQNMPESVLSQVKPILQNLQWLFPGWMQKLYVHWNYASDKGESARVLVNYEYRWMRLDIYPEFLGNEDSRTEELMHELLHGFTSVLANYARDQIKRLVPESEAPKYHETLIEELTARHESLVQDLAFALHQKLKNLNP